MAYCNPIDAATMRRAIEIADPPPGGVALDIGCGKGELLLTLARDRALRGVGIEKSALMHAEATARVRECGLDARVEIRLADAAAEIPGLPDASFDLGACIGSGHAAGGAAGALRALHRLARPGGTVIWGEGYWKQPPSAEYLRRLGGTEDELTTHAGNVALAVSLGFVPRWAVTATEREWDEYEWAYARNVERFVSEHPQDPDGAAMVERCRGWRDLVLEQGRGTMGFGVYVLGRG